jgi:hypothetical protein
MFLLAPLRIPIACNIAIYVLLDVFCIPEMFLFLFLSFLYLLSVIVPTFSTCCLYPLHPPVLHPKVINCWFLMVHIHTCSYRFLCGSQSLILLVDANLFCSSCTRHHSFLSSRKAIAAPIRLPVCSSLLIFLLVSFLFLLILSFFLLLCSFSYISLLLCA